MSQSIDAPDRFVHKGKSYSLLAAYATDNVARSWSWKYGHGYVPADHDSIHATHYLCCVGECRTLIKLGRGQVTNVYRHLATEHHIDEGEHRTRTPARSLFRSSQSSSSLPSTATSLGIRPSQSRIVATFNVSAFRTHLLRWIVEDHIPFSVVYSQSFRGMLLALNPGIERHIPSPNTVRSMVVNAFNVEKETVKASLRSSLSKVHLSFDKWTSPNRLAILAIVAHYVVDVPQVGASCTAKLLALKRMKRNHTGEDISRELDVVIREYGIQNNLGVFMADNESCNDTAVRDYCKRCLSPGTDWEERRARCIGHVINLGAKDFLFGDDVDAFEYEIAGVLATDSFNSERVKRQRAEWRKQGPIGVLHNLVLLIRGSPLRSEQFKAIRLGLIEHGDDLELIQDNSTRWNSHFLSIERGQKLRPRLDAFCQQQADVVGVDRLSPDDWQRLEGIYQALKPFYRTTKLLESRAGTGHHGSVWEWLPTIEWLLKRAGQGRVNASDRGDTMLAVAYQNAHQKLEKYWQLTDKSHLIYAAATLLLPMGKQVYFDNNWNNVKTTAKWKKQMLQKVRQHWEKNYKDNAAYNDDDNNIEPSPLEEQLGMPTLAEKDPWSKYISSPPIPVDDKLNIISWWATQGPKELRQFAFDVLSIPAMSSEVERVFSSVKMILPAQRRRLKDDIIEAAELLRYWYRQRGHDASPLVEALFEELKIDDDDQDLEDDDDVITGYPNRPSER